MREWVHLSAKIGRMKGMHRREAACSGASGSACSKATALLEARAREECIAALYDLARLVDGTPDSEGAALTDELLSSGAIDCIARLLEDEAPDEISSVALMLLGNFCSDGFNARSKEARRSPLAHLIGGHSRVLACLSPLLLISPR